MLSSDKEHKNGTLHLHRTQHNISSNVHIHEQDLVNGVVSRNDRIVLGVPLDLSSCVGRPFRKRDSKVILALHTYSFLPSREYFGLCFISDNLRQYWMAMVFLHPSHDDGSNLYRYLHSTSKIYGPSENCP